MTWRITWSEALHADLDIAGPELFDRAGHAVLRFAETGEGKAYPVDIDGLVWRFFVPGGQVHVRVNLETDTLEVIQIAPDAPLPRAAPLLDEPDKGDDD